MVASADAIRGDIYAEMGDTIKGLEDLAFAIKSAPLIMLFIKIAVRSILNKVNLNFLTPIIRR